MKIAIPYDNGEVFGHFGKTEKFKIYDVEDNKVTNAEVIDSEGEGHSMLASILAAKGVEVVLCGGIGDGAQEALSTAGIEIVSGVEGDADVAISRYLMGELTSEGVNCNCGEDGEGCNCGDSCGGGCGGCGGGCGGCGGGMKPLFEGENVGKICAVHYTGTYDDGTVFDSSYERKEPIQFICGVGMMIRGFDMAVANMKIGDKVKIHLTAEEAYGEYDPNRVLEAPIEGLPGAEDLEVGEQVVLGDGYGRQFPVTVIEKTDTMIKLDANHEMAGKELNFEIEMVNIIEDEV